MTGWNQEQAETLIAQFRNGDGSALPVLHALQAAFGFVPEDAIPLIATALNRSPAEIHGVVTFYHDFRRTAPGRHILRLCRAEACQSMGADRLAARARQRLRVGWGETTADGAVTLEPVFCLGLCACAPAAMLDGAVHGRLDASRLDALLNDVVSSG